MAGVSIAQELAGHLLTCRIPDHLIGEPSEKPFQVWTGQRVAEWLNQSALHAKALVELAGGGVRAVHVPPTSFWPDVAVLSDESSGLLAVEVKCLTRTGLPGSVATSIGQAFIYRERYDECLIVLFVVEPLSVELPEGVLTRLASQNVHAATIPAYHGMMISG